MTEAVGGMMDKSRSGRRNVQQQNEQDIVLKLLPTLNEGLAMKKVPDLRVACYMLLSVMASKGGLDDKILTAMMEAVVLGWTIDTTAPGLVCLSVLAQHRSSKYLTKKIVKELLRIPNFAAGLTQISKQHQVEKLANALSLTLVERLRKEGDVVGLPIVEHIVANEILSESQSGAVIKSLLLAASGVESAVSNNVESRASLASTFASLTNLSGRVGLVVQSAIADSEIDIDELELKLQTTIRFTKQIQGVEDEEMVDDTQESTIQNPAIEVILGQLPKRTTTETSFLSHTASHIYPDLCRAFLASTPSSADLDLFDSVPILRRDSALEDAIYLTFYMKTWCGPYPVLSRTSALQMAARRVTEAKSAGTDLQALIPYVVVALSDTSARIRQAAADLLIAVNEVYPASSESKKKSKQLLSWASDDLYGTAQSKNVRWLTSDIASKLVAEILVPALEECVLDKQHIISVLQNSLAKVGTESPRKADSSRLSQAARSSIMSFFSSHVQHTPLLTVKLHLLECLNAVRSVSGISRTKFLLPAFQQWIGTNVSTHQQSCQAEKVSIDDLNNQISAIITATDKDGLQLLTAIVSGESSMDNSGFLSAAFKRLRNIWTAIKDETKLDIAQKLLETSQSSKDASVYQNLASDESADFLKTMPLSTEVLAIFLEQLPTAAKLADKPPATKRRRTSHGEVARTPIQEPEQLAVAIKRVTFVLQLLHSSNPGSHPDLLRPIFNTLAELQHFKAQVASELAYLQGLVLECLLAILQADKLNPKHKLDKSAIRADLLVDCIQKTASPQVQNTALLLVASLADSAPELVLHSVMPIFTFIGNSVLRQNDEYSAHVITQTIREVIPPLIASLRKDKGNPVTGAAELLLSFVAAYEHVPSHRRKGLFVSLVQTLGAEDFLFALLAMLADKYGPTDDIKTFAVDISSSFSVETQLQSYVKNIELIVDLFKAKPTYSSVLLGANDEGSADTRRLALTQFALLPPLLSQKKLVAQTAKLLDRDDMDAARIRDVYAALLEKLLSLADSLKSQESLHNACGDVLESLLGLLSTSEFVKSVESLLDRPNESLRRKILRSLEVRIDQESASSSVSRTAMLGFLPQLTAIIRESKDVLYKHIAVACVDKIAEKYGKKDVEAVAAAAETIASVHCLGQTDARLRIMALLCLASLVEILREGIVSVLPTAIPTCLQYMEDSINDSVEAQRLHNAGFAFISALTQHLPYMISGGYLDKLLAISNASAEAVLDNDSDETREQCLQLAAKQIDAKSMFGALEKNWEIAVGLGFLVSLFGFWQAKILTTSRLSVNIFKCLVSLSKSIPRVLSPNILKHLPEFSKTLSTLGDHGLLPTKQISMQSFLSSSMLSMKLLSR